MARAVKINVLWDDLSLAPLKTPCRIFHWTERSRRGTTGGWASPGSRSPWGPLTRLISLYAFPERPGRFELVGLALLIVSIALVLNGGR